MEITLFRFRVKLFEEKVLPPLRKGCMTIGDFKEEFVRLQSNDILLRPVTEKELDEPLENEQVFFVCSQAQEG